MINNGDKIRDPMGYPPRGVISFGDRETGSGLSAGSTASVQPPLSQAAAAETTAAAATMSSWSCRTGSLAFEATGSSPCTSDVGHDHGQRDAMRTVMRDCQRQPAAAASIISPLPAASADATALSGKPSPNRLHIRQSSSDGGRFTTRSSITACDARRRVAAVTTEQQTPVSATGAAVALFGILVLNQLAACRRQWSVRNND